MPRTCTVCTHRDREDIDRSLLAGDAFRHIAARSGTSTGALQRHKAEHIAHALLKANDDRESAHGNSLLDQVRELQVRAMSILDKAEQAGDLRTAIAAIGQCKSVLALVAQVTPAEEPPEPPAAAMFSLNQVFVGAPSSGLTPMSDGTYPEMAGYIEGRRIPIEPGSQIGERGPGPWGSRQRPFAGDEE